MRIAKVILLWVRMGHLQVNICFRLVKVLVVKFLAGTSFIDKFIECI